MTDENIKNKKEFKAIFGNGGLKQVIENGYLSNTEIQKVIDEEINMSDENIKLAGSYIAMSIIISTLIYSGAITDKIYLMVIGIILMFLVKLWQW